MSRSKMFNFVAQGAVFPCPPDFGRFIAKSGYITAFNSTLYTVPVGYILCITDWNLCVSTTSNGNGSIYAQTSGGVEVHKFGYIRLQTAGSLSQGYSLTTPYIFDAGHKILILSNNGSTEVTGSFHGWEFDAY